LKNESSDGWQIISISHRFRSLLEKFNALAGLAQGDILVVWKDATGRFDASLAFRREAVNGIGGGPLTKRGDPARQRIARPAADRSPDSDSEILILNRNHQIPQVAIFVLSLPDRRVADESGNSDSRLVNE
jgi:hypothetical protein